MILLDSKRITFLEDGSCAEGGVHRVVWIGTSVGVRTYADLRIPWNSENATLEVEKLRTWRRAAGGRTRRRVSDTAVVHTLPHALDHADDYTAMRETMLLHDGVEVLDKGCIMETAYTITTRDVPARGGIHVFSQGDPVVLSELGIYSSPRRPLKNAELNGAPLPAQDKSMLNNRKTWNLKHVKAQGRPHTSDPQAHEPAVVWSNWEDWNELGQRFSSTFNAGVELTEVQRQDLLERLNPALSFRQKLAAVGDYLNEMVRPVHYDDRNWRFAPRPACRVLETAYGHDLDRAVLAAALLQTAGLGTEPMFVGPGRVLVDETCPPPR